MVGDGMAGSLLGRNQGDPPETSGVGPRGSKRRPAGVRASVVAMKRVTTVEPRDAGKWMSDEPERRNQTDVSGGNASTNRRSPRPVVVGGNDRVDRTHVGAGDGGGSHTPRP